MSDQEQGNGEGSTPEYAASKRKSPPVVTNDGTVRDELSAPEKLRIGGFAAPILRAAAKDGRSRRKVNVVGKDGTVRESTLGEVQQGLIVAHGLEFEVAEKTPETTYACRVCAREFVWEKRGKVPPICESCTSARHTCTCGARVGRNAMSPTSVAKRKGRPPTCKTCSAKLHGEKLSVTLAKKARPQPKCASCGKALRRTAMSPSLVARRNGGPPECVPCHLKAARERLKDARAKKKAGES